MKHKNNLLIAITVSLISLTSLIGCSSKCKHKNVSFEYTVEPTCTLSGSAKLVCDTCKKVIYTVNNINPKGHKVYGDWIIDNEPTCEGIGKKHKNCSVCNEKVYEENIPAKSHLNCVWETKLEPTCTDDGKEIYKCLECKKELDSRDIPAKGHKLGREEIKGSTCSQKGYKKTYCDTCKEVILDEDLDLLPHSFEFKETLSATCTEKGLKTQICSKCGAEGISEEIEPLGHIYVKSYNQEGTEQATCTKKGTVREMCNRNGCNETRLIETDYLGHDCIAEDSPEYHDGCAPLYKRNCMYCNALVYSWNQLAITEECNTLNQGEPNIIKFYGITYMYGRPIGNKIEVNNSGFPTSNKTSVPDKNVNGSYFEYKIYMEEALSDFSFYAYMKADEAYGNQFFEVPEDDPYKGYRFEGDTPIAITECGYLLFVNGKEVPFDPTVEKSIYESNVKYYRYPFTFNLTSGINTIKIVRASGSSHEYLGFNIVKQAQ